MKLRIIIPYILPAAVLLIVMVLFFRYIMTRQDQKDDSCEPYRNNLVNKLPAKCYTYFGIKD